MRWKIQSTKKMVIAEMVAAAGFILKHEKRNATESMTLAFTAIEGMK